MLIKHLMQRGMGDFDYDMVLDHESEIVTFMLYGVADFIINRDNIKPLGYQQYRHLVTEKKTNDPRNSRYYTYQPKCSVINDVVVFGLESLQFMHSTHSLHIKPENLFITEGIFEAVNLHRLGYPAIAVLTSDPNKRLKGLLPYLAHKTTWCGDNDKAGNKSWLARACDYRLLLDSDLDETPDEEIIKKIHELNLEESNESE